MSSSRPYYSSTVIVTPFLWLVFFELFWHEDVIKWYIFSYKQGCLKDKMQISYDYGFIENGKNQSRMLLFIVIYCISLSYFYHVRNNDFMKIPSVWLLIIYQLFVLASQAKLVINLCVAFIAHNE